MTLDAQALEAAGTDGSGLAADVRVRLGSLDLRATIHVAAGEVLAVLGPNGAGKTMLLRALAGLQPVADGGSIVLDATVLDAPAAPGGGRGTFVAPEDRPVALVFQQHLLFEHLSVLDNVAFGLRADGASKAAARVEAQRWLDRLDLAALAAERPRALSGGQAQRVALARALATEPHLLLLDEPTASLDASLRPAIRRELRAVLADFGGCAVLVTHDPLDALALAQHVVVLEGGAVTQAGPIAEVTARPRTPYVADLLGVNLLTGVGHGTEVVLDAPANGPTGGPSDQPGASVVVADVAEGPTLVLVRPNAVALHRHRPEGSARNQWQGEVLGLDLLGERVRVRVGGAVPLVAEVTTAAVADLGLAEGQAVWTSVKATEVVTYPA